MPEGKYFYIRSKLNGLVLDVRGENAAAGTEVIMWPKKEGEAANQIWVEDHLTGCIRSSLDEDKCLTISDDNILVIDTYDGPGNQFWTPVGERIQNRADSDRVLDVLDGSEGANIGAKPYDGGDNQRWEFEYLEARMFHIISELNGLYLTCDDEKLKMYPLEAENERQIWHEDRHGLLYCKANHLTLSSKKGVGKKVKLDYFEPGKEYQMWSKSGNKIVLRTQPSIVLDIKGQNKQEGAKVIAWQYLEQDNQHWRYEYL